MSPAISWWVAPTLDLLFPPRCAICLADFGPCDELPLCRDAMLCRECLEHVARCEARCTTCGEPLRDGECRRCRRVAWSWIGVVGGYDGLAREAVLRGKRPAGAGVLRAVSAVWVDQHGPAVKGWGVDCVVPVPMHWRRRLARGSSAADELAASIARRLRLPVDRRLSRRRATPMQNELPPEDRGANVRGAFRCRGRFDGARVLLVDDVVTTGETLASCSNTLFDAGAVAVCVAAMLKADRHLQEDRANP